MVLTTVIAHPSTSPIVNLIQLILFVVISVFFISRFLIGLVEHIFLIYKVKLVKRDLLIKDLLMATEARDNGDMSEEEFDSFVQEIYKADKALEKIMQNLRQ